MILGIESSCDESALALFEPGSGIIGEWVHSQISLHEAYGGVVPDLASREHLQNFLPLLKASDILNYQGEIQQIAVTKGPGLAGCLALGIAFAKGLSLAWGVPVFGVNHLRGHAYSPFIELYKSMPKAFKENFEELLPHLGLIVSGGNTILFEISREKKIQVLAETVDDAAGEALDKGAKLLGLPYPGGPKIEALAANGDSRAFDFPRAIAPRNVSRFSFSGLKTSLRYRIETMEDAELEQSLPDICASYQAAVVDQLYGKTKHLLKAKSYRSLGLSGGVANNNALRAALKNLADRYKIDCYIAEPKHTGDNAAMIAFAAYADSESTCKLAISIEPALRLGA